MIIAVMEKKLGIRLSDKDVYVNIVGGMKPDSTSTDLAVALAIYSALFDKTSKQPSVAIGEVGLTGELRSVGNVDKIISEAERLGYKKLVVPFGNYSRLEKSGSISELDKSMIAPAKSLAEAVQLMQQ